MQRQKHRLVPILLLFFLACAHSNKDVCGGRVVIDSTEKFTFNDNEEPLMCGDPKLDSWSEIPLSQTEFSMNAFLKSRGYYEPKITLHGERLHVEPGKKFKVKSVVYEGAPEHFFDTNYVGWKESDFTSATFNEIESWTLKRLKSMGYACPVIKLEAFTAEENVRVNIIPGYRFDFPSISYGKENALKTSVMSRFYAFQEGRPYNQDLLSLSSSRMELQDIVNYSIFTTECKGKDIRVTHSVSLGEPHLLRIGVGASTEEYPIARIGWKNSRLGENGSSFSAELHASQLRQNLSLNYEWHLFNNFNRWFYMPLVEAKRVYEKDQKYKAISFFNAIGSSLDYKNITYDVKFGPSIAYEDVQAGPTIGNKRFTTFRTSNLLRTHEFQVNSAEPQGGSVFSLDTSSIIETTAQSFDAHWISFSGTNLLNLKRIDPPQHIFGIRYGLESVVAKGTSDLRFNLPAEYFTWLGGDKDVRGFKRRELPLNQNGALSSAFMGIEIRAPSWFVKNLDPFIFTDAGFLGTENFRLLSTLYWSPGFGLRWASPIGVIRTTLAHGYAASKESEKPDYEHLQAFLSLGQEF